MPHNFGATGQPTQNACGHHHFVYHRLKALQTMDVASVCHRRKCEDNRQALCSTENIKG